MSMRKVQLKDARANLSAMVDQAARAGNRDEANNALLILVWESGRGVIS